MKLFVGLVLFGALGLFALYVATWFLNPFDFGPCDGSGPANGTRRHLRANGTLEWEGTVKDCLWDGSVSHYQETGRVESVCGYRAGKKHGTALYFTPEGEPYKRERYVDGSLTEFEIRDLEAEAWYILKHDTLQRFSDEGTRATAFTRPCAMRGYDVPFVSVHAHKLVLRGAQDLYLINTDLGVELDLRDTLMNYISSAYTERVDISGNHFTFQWHRDIVQDRLLVKVWYDADQHQSGGKVWERAFSL